MAMKLSLEITNKKDFKLFSELAKRLGVSFSVEKKEAPTNDAQSVIKEFAGKLPLKSIPDPVQWQREQRKDRKLPGRDE